MPSYHKKYLFKVKSHKKLEEVYNSLKLAYNEAALKDIKDRIDYFNYLVDELEECL